MRDINPAERLLSLFTSPESAAGIVGDLSEERGQRGRVWFWRQVLGTAFSLCRGTWFASPVLVPLLVLFGIALELGMLTIGNRIVVPWNWSALSVATIYQLIRYSQPLITGAVLVAAAPRLGMAACVLLAVVSDLLMLFIILDAYTNFSQATGWALLRSEIIGLFVFPIALCLGGAIVRRRRMVRHACEVA